MCLQLSNRVTSKSGVDPMAPRLRPWQSAVFNSEKRGCIFAQQWLKSRGRAAKFDHSVRLQQRCDFPSDNGTDCEVAISEGVCSALLSIVRGECLPALVETPY